MSDTVFCDECKFFPRWFGINGIQKCKAYRRDDYISRKNLGGTKHNYCSIQNRYGNCEYFKAR